MQILQKVVRVGLLDVGSVKLKGHEHNTGKDHDANIDLANESVFFTPRPSCQWIEPS
jgi:hypothetical protein